jgi:hypothetical protein
MARLHTKTLAAMGASLALALSPQALGGGMVWVVDDDGGPGVHFLDVQSAINAAAEGDVVLVKPGDYGSFTIFQKSVHVAAEVDGTARCHGGFSVRGLSAAQSAVVRGVKVVNPLEDGLQVKNCAGKVWIEACALLGNDGDGIYSSPAYHPEGYHGALVSGADAVSFVRCDLVGGGGADYAPLLSGYGPGGAGVEMDDASIALYDCKLRGGLGGSVFDDDAAWQGGTGGHGLAIDAGFLFASGSEFRGGDGGVGGEDYDIFIGYSCDDGGPGGYGIHQESYMTGPAAVSLLDCTLLGGAGGPPFPGSGCAFGPPGGDVSVPNGTVQKLTGAAKSYFVSSPKREGEKLNLTFDGQSGDLVVLAIAGSPGFLYQPGLSGVLLLDPSLLVWSIGVIPPGGTLVSELTAGVSVPAGEAKTYFTQAGCFTPSTLAWTLGPGSWLVVLDKAL